MNLDLLEKLTQTFGPSGYEDAIRDIIRAEVAPLVDEVRIDPLGSLVAYRRGTGGGQKIALAAHMDEIGLMATYIEEQGYVRFTAIGGGVRALNASASACGLPTASPASLRWSGATMLTACRP